MSSILIFDISLRGFARRYGKYLRKIGYKVLIAPDSLKLDDFLAEYARRINAIIITTDKRFPYSNKIVLPMDRKKQNGELVKPKYEVWYTYLIKSLASRNLHGSMSIRSRPGGREAR